ncbi:uncharacterized protein LOC119680725 [Teleopsis dalmanni]|uniref:uncharacterized protein LOC119680725 n=1 Tax=Teleopsis dalmanni TaxID=139649 RepID=UPI0018CDB664|nr:uncharacterized protein LOC119680725 [Teleopsis dalmanni]
MSRGTKDLKMTKQERLLKFIDLYKSHEELWNIDCKNYRRVDWKETAMAMIGDEVNMTAENVKKRIKSIRTTYTAEKKKIENSIKAGADGDDIYQPSLWWYPHMSFLDASINRRAIMNKTDLLDNLSPPSKKKKTREDKMSTYEEDEPIQLAVTKLQENATDNDPLAKSWAMQYNEMNSRQKTLARKIISDVLFHGCMGNLEMSHAMKIQSIFLQPAVRPNMEETTDSFEVTYLTDMKSPIDY